MHQWSASVTKTQNQLVQDLLGFACMRAQSDNARRGCSGSHYEVRGSTQHIFVSRPQPHLFGTRLRPTTKVVYRLPFPSHPLNIQASRCAVTCICKSLIDKREVTQQRARDRSNCKVESQIWPTTKHCLLEAVCNLRAFSTCCCCGPGPGLSRLAYMSRLQSRRQPREASHGHAVTSLTALTVSFTSCVCLCVCVCVCVRVCAGCVACSPRSGMTRVERLSSWAAAAAVHCHYFCRCFVPRSGFCLYRFLMSVTALQCWTGEQRQRGAWGASSLT